MPIDMRRRTFLKLVAFGALAAAAPEIVLARPRVSKAEDAAVALHLEDPREFEVYHEILWENGDNVPRKVNFWPVRLGSNGPLPDDFPSKIATDEIPVVVALYMPYPIGITRVLSMIHRENWNLPGLEKGIATVPMIATDITREGATLAFVRRFGFPGYIGYAAAGYKGGAITL